MKRIAWRDQAKADVRALDRTTAMNILRGIHRFADTKTGNVKRLQDREETRLRIGDYRVFFLEDEGKGIEIQRVLHRSEAYR